jgi:hypothetical protein
MTNPSAIATIPTNRAIIPFMRQLMGTDSLGIAMIGGTLHWMALPVQQGMGKVLKRPATSGWGDYSASCDWLCHTSVFQTDLFCFAHRTRSNHSVLA